MKNPFEAYPTTYVKCAFARALQEDCIGTDAFLERASYWCLFWWNHPDHATAPILTDSRSLAALLPAPKAPDQQRAAINAGARPMQRVGSVIRTLPVIKETANV